MVADVTELRPRTTRKRERLIYVIRADLKWLHSLTHRSYLGKSGPTWWALPTKWLWTPPYSQLSVSELGALAKLVCMFMRDQDSYNTGTLESDRKELRLHGLSDALLHKLCNNFGKVEISLVSGSGEIKDL